MSPGTPVAVTWDTAFRSRSSRRLSLRGRFASIGIDRLLVGPGGPANRGWTPHPHGEGALGGTVPTARREPPTAVPDPDGRGPGASTRDAVGLQDRGPAEGSLRSPRAHLPRACRTAVDGWCRAGFAPDGRGDAASGARDTGENGMRPAPVRPTPRASQGRPPTSQLSPHWCRTTAISSPIRPYLPDARTGRPRPRSTADGTVPETAPTPRARHRYAWAATVAPWSPVTDGSIMPPVPPRSPRTHPGPP